MLNLWKRQSPHSFQSMHMNNILSWKSILNISKHRMHFASHHSSRSTIVPICHFWRWRRGHVGTLEQQNECRNNDNVPSRVRICRAHLFAVRACPFIGAFRLITADAIVITLLFVSGEIPRGKFCSL